MTCPFTSGVQPTLQSEAQADAPQPALATDKASQALHHFDPALQAYVIARPDLLRQALSHPDLGVRPPEQLLPPALHGRRFGAIYGHWLRMREDETRSAERKALEQALASLDSRVLEAEVQLQARLALSQGWEAWQWSSLPASLAAMLGVPMSSAADQASLRQQLQALAQALRPEAGPRELDAADQACEVLTQGLGRQGPAPLWRGLSLPNWDAAAQAIGFLWQSHEAGAGLLGQALLAGTGHEADLLRLAQSPGVIQHTRRWALHDCRLGDSFIPRGTALLLRLACEPAEPGAGLSFGHGRHQCPGQELALLMAQAALGVARQALAQGIAPPSWQGHHALAHARVPRLADRADRDESLVLADAKLPAERAPTPSTTAQESRP